MQSKLKTYSVRRSRPNTAILNWVCRDRESNPDIKHARHWTFVVFRLKNCPTDVIEFIE